MAILESSCGHTRKLLGKFLFSSFPKNPVISSLYNVNLPPTTIHTRAYVNVYMKWKKDPFFDSIESIHKSIELKPLIVLKNFIISASPQDYCIPISAVSKKGLQLGIKIKVARCLRKYPSFFEEFVGPEYNLPWFRLIQVIELDKEEREVYRESKLDILQRLRKLILMSVGDRKVLPSRIIQGLQWYLGLPGEFLRDPEGNLNGFFRVVEMGDGLKGLAPVDSDGNNGRPMSILEKNARKRGVYSGDGTDTLAFPLFPSKGLRLKTKISDWLDEFQRLPYVSPYEDCSNVRSDSDISEKRVVGMLHELLGLFVEHAAERKRLLCSRKYMGFPQKVHKAFERHPHVFYLSLKNNTCTAILKEAYRDNSAIDAHPVAEVRKKYISLMKESEFILKSRRVNRRACNHEVNGHGEDLDCEDDAVTKEEEVKAM